MDYWIYPGERRPVIVKAHTWTEAVKLVSESPHYDGFPIDVFRVSEFCALCQDGMAPGKLIGD